LMISSKVEKPKNRHSGALFSPRLTGKNRNPEISTRHKNTGHRFSPV
jgi:hypothetical protein